MLIGKALRATGVHAHYATQFTIGSQDGILFRPGESEAWTAYAAAVIASRQPHMMDASTVEFSATMLLEPETPLGRELAELHPTDGIASIPRASVANAASALFATWKHYRDRDETAAAARNAIAALTGGAHPHSISDERVIRAIAYINTHLSGTLTLTEIAGQAYLSPTRFRHLFVEQTGTALRPYVLWRRFLRAWDVIRRGDSMSEAAYEAGFADAAHFTRTSQRMFGFAPSALLVGRHASS
jgi:AraC family transcriptional regulator